MNGNSGAHFVPPNSNGQRQQHYQQQQQQQSYNAYGSYASSNTFYDPAFTPPSKQSSVGYNTKVEHQQLESPYSASSHHALDPRTAPVSGYSAKGAYAPGGYAQGPADGRTPSPTPSELEDMKRGVVDWKKVFNWRTYAKKQYIIYYIIFIIIIVLVALMTIYHKEIVQWLKPVATWMQGFKFGWVIPIAVLFVISFPPLFGHEIVAVLCGLVWGLWVGFGIVAAGTLLGEIGNYYAFKYCCSARGEKMEKTKLSYACLARTVREGGFKIALIARLSAIPGHFTTAVFATCGMGIFVFTLAAILSMPKQFITVYLGVILEQSNDSAAQQAANNTSHLISNIVLAVTLVITIAAGWWIWREMNRVRPAVIRERRQAKKKLIAPSVETAYLSRGSNVDVSSEEDMTATPVRNNEPHMGGYGYSGYGNQASYSNDTINAPIPRRSNPANEEWAMSERTRTEGYPPPQQSQQQLYTDPDHESEKSGQAHYRQTSSPPRARVNAQSPQIDGVSNLTGTRRLDREKWETSEGTSTVGMGSWGGILREGSGPQRHLQQRQASYDDPSTPRPHGYQQHQLQQQQQHSQRPDEYGMGGGLSALGAPMGGGDTVSVKSKHVEGARQSREMPGHVAGRSMRAVVEGSGGSIGEDDSVLAYGASPALYGAPSGRHGYALSDNGFQPSPSASSSRGAGGSGYHQNDASAGTFGDGRSSLHSREFASNERDESFVPPLPTNRR